MLDQYPSPHTIPEPPAEPPATFWEIAPAVLSEAEQREYRGWIALRARVHDGIEACTDPALLAALENGEAAVEWELQLLNYRAGNHSASLPPRRIQIRVGVVGGPTDRAYRDGLVRVASMLPLAGITRGVPVLAIGSGRFCRPLERAAATRS